MSAPSDPLRQKLTGRAYCSGATALASRIFHAPHRGACDPARVNARSDGGEVLYAGELEIRPREGLVLATGQALTLSVREFQLLVEMARRAGTIVTRDELYRAVWSGELRAGDRSVDVYVSKQTPRQARGGDAGPAVHPHASRLRLPLPPPAGPGRRDD